MKRFTQKFFLLTVGMILSVGAYAQDEIKHRFPQFDFTYEVNGQTIHAYVPAWDVRTYSETSNSGSVRIQATKLTKTETVNNKPFYYFDSKLVTRYAIRKDKLYFADISSSTKITFTDKSGQEKTLNANQIHYGLIVPDTYDDDGWWNKFTYSSTYKVFDFTNSGAFCIDADNYTIVTEKTGSSDKHTIKEIDSYAFRNNSASNTENSYWFRPKNITIPASIEKIGQGAFFSSYSVETVTFEPKSKIQEIPPQAFMNYRKLEEINLPSIKTIWGAALGGCALLKKITFEGEKAPDFKLFNFQNYKTGIEQDHKWFEGTGGFSDVLPENCIIEVPLHSAKQYVDAENSDFIKFPMSSKFQFPTDKAYISYCSDLPFTFKQYATASQSWNDGGMEVYYVQDSDVKLSEGKIDITKITATKIPSETEQGITPLDNYNKEVGFGTGFFGVILHGTNADNEDGSYNIFYPNNLPCDEVSPRGNLLQGVIKDAQIDVIEDYLFFVLSKSKFLTVEAPGKLAAHKAFLLYTGDQTMPLGARELSISLPEETGIMNHEVNRVQNDVFYNLQGIQVKQPSKGIFIKNGKKFVIK